MRGVGYIWRGVGGVVRVGEWRLGAGYRHAGTGLLDSPPKGSPQSSEMLDAGYVKDGKRLSGYQKIRVQVIRTAGYQVKRTVGGWVNALMSGCVSREE